MAAPRKLPGKDVLISLRNRGWTDQQIAAQYGVSKHAVYLQLRDAGATKARPNYRAFIPWRVRRAHTWTYPPTMLRYLAQQSEGKELPEAKARLLRKWLADIREADVVVCYDPEIPPNPASPVTGGFYYARRRPEDGESIIRQPEGQAAREQG